MENEILARTVLLKVDLDHRDRREVIFYDDNGRFIGRVVLMGLFWSDNEIVERALELAPDLAEKYSQVYVSGGGVS